VLSFDFYWLYKAVVLIVSVSITYLRIRDVQAADWPAQLEGLADLPGRERVLEDRIGRIRARVRELERAGERLAARGGWRELRRLEHELLTVKRLLASGIEPLDPRRLV
jgi:hypothetical protein